MCAMDYDHRTLALKSAGTEGILHIQRAKVGKEKSTFKSAVNIRVLNRFRL